MWAQLWCNAITLNVSVERRKRKVLLRSSAKDTPPEIPAGHVTQLIHPFNFSKSIAYYITLLHTVIIIFILLHILLLLSGRYFYL